MHLVAWTWVPTGEKEKDVFMITGNSWSTVFTCFLGFHFQSSRCSSRSPWSFKERGSGCQQGTGNARPAALEQMLLTKNRFLSVLRCSRTAELFHFSWLICSYALRIASTCSKNTGHVGSGLFQRHRKNFESGIPWALSRQMCYGSFFWVFWNPVSPDTGKITLICWKANNTRAYGTSSGKQLLVCGICVSETLWVCFLISQVGITVLNEMMGG